MAAPSGKIPLPPEAYAALGDFRSAIRELTKLKGELETIATQTIAAQGKIDPATKSQIDQTKAKITYYKAQEETRKVAAEEARKSTAKTVAGLLNTHNPHGALRSLLSGSASTGGTVTNLASNIGGLMQKAGMAGGGTALAGAGTSLMNSAAAIAGPAALAALITHMVVQATEKVAAQTEQNQSRKKQLAGESLAFTRSNRFTSFYTADELAEQRRRIDRAFKRGSADNQSVYDLIFEDRPDATQRGLDAQAFMQEKIRIERKLQQILGKRATGKTLDPNQYLNDKEVVYNATDVRKIGFTERTARNLAQMAKYNPFTWLPAMFLPDYDGQAIKKEAEKKALENGRKVLKEQEDAMKAWFELPVNRTIAAQFERHSRTVEEFEIERVGKWNPY